MLPRSLLLYNSLSNHRRRQHRHLHRRRSWSWCLSSLMGVDKSTYNTAICEKLLNDAGKLPCRLLYANDNWLTDNPPAEHVTPCHLFMHGSPSSQFSLFCHCSPLLDVYKSCNACPGLPSTTPHRVNHKPIQSTPICGTTLRSTDTETYVVPSALVVVASQLAVLISCNHA
jgi:hypothetical protein